MQNMLSMHNTLLSDVLHQELFQLIYDKGVCFSFLGKQEDTFNKKAALIRLNSNMIIVEEHILPYQQ